MCRCRHRGRKSSQTRNTLDSPAITMKFVNALFSSRWKEKIKSTKMKKKKQKKSVRCARVERKTKKKKNQKKKGKGTRNPENDNISEGEAACRETLRRVSFPRVTQEMCDLPLCRQFLCTHCNLRTCYCRAEKRCWVRDSCKPPGYTSPRLLPPRLPCNPSIHPLFFVLPVATLPARHCLCHPFLPFSVQRLFSSLRISLLVFVSLFLWLALGLPIFLFVLEFFPLLRWRSHLFLRVPLPFLMIFFSSLVRALSYFRLSRFSSFPCFTSYPSPFPFFSVQRHDFRFGYLATRGWRGVERGSLLSVSSFSIFRSF